MLSPTDFVSILLAPSKPGSFTQWSTFPGPNWLMVLKREEVPNPLAVTTPLNIASIGKKDLYGCGFIDFTVGIKSVVVRAVARANWNGAPPSPRMALLLKFGSTLMQGPDIAFPFTDSLASPLADYEYEFDTGGAVTGPLGIEFGVINVNGTGLEIVDQVSAEARVAKPGRVRKFRRS